MGSNISMMKRNSQLRRKTNFKNSEIQGIRQCISQMKSICGNKLINDSQFAEVFGESQQMFDLFARENGQIDPSEFMIGICLFAKDSFTEKCRCIFDLLNVNSLNAVSFFEFEYFLHTCLRFSFTIFELNCDPIRSELTEMLDLHFLRDQRIGISDILIFFFNCVEVSQFLIEIEQEVPSTEFLAKSLKSREISSEGKYIPEYFKNMLEQKSKTKKQLQVLSKETTGDLSRSSAVRNRNNLILEFFENEVVSHPKLFQINKITPVLNWIFGFRCQNVVNSFEFHASSLADKVLNSSSNKLIYFVSNVVIVFYYKMNMQKHYKQHSNPICSIAISQNNNLCASGDEGGESFIHVWEIESQKNICVLLFLPMTSVNLLAFTNNDRYLIAIGVGIDSPLRIYDIHNSTLVVSMWFEGIALNITPLINLSGSFEVEGKKTQNYHNWKLESSFLVFSANNIVLFLFSKAKKEYDRFSFNLANFGKYNSDTISCCLLFYQHKVNPKLMLYGSPSDFELSILTGTKSGRLFLLSKFFQNSPVELDEIFNFKAPITHLVHDKDQYFYVVLNGNCILVLNILLGVVTESIEMNLLAVDVKSSIIKNLKRGRNKKVFLATTEGDLLQISFLKKNSWIKTPSPNKITAKRIKNIESFPNKIVQICLIEMQQAENSIIFVCTKDSAIYGFLLKDHSLMYTKSIGSKITCMNGVARLTGGFFLACGTQSGNLYIKGDLQDSLNCFDCGSQINCVQFSENSRFLIAGSNNGKIFIFESINSNHFDKTPKEVVLVTGSVMSVNFLLDIATSILFTDEMKCFKMDIEGNLTDVQFKNSVKKPNFEKLEIEKIRFKYYVDKHTSISLVYIDVNLGIAIVGEKGGIVSIYESLEHFANNSPTYYRGQSGQIKEFELSMQKNKIYHFSEENEAFAESNLNIEFQRNPKLEQSKNKKEREFGHYVKDPMITRPVVSNFTHCSQRQFISDGYAYIGELQSDLPFEFFSKPSKVQSKLSALKKRCPSSSIKIKHVFGIESIDTKDSIFYLHGKIDQTMCENSSNIQSDKQSEKEIKNSTIFSKDFYKICNSDILSQNLVNSKLEILHENKETNSDFERDNTSESDFNNHELVVNNMVPKKRKQDINSENNADRIFTHYITRPACDLGCSREIVYVVSRFVIIIAIEEPSRQKIYQGHDRRVSCIDFSKSFKRIASVDAVIFPKIHVWCPRTLLLHSAIETFHPLPIFALKFTFDSKFIVSVSNAKAVCFQYSCIQTQKLVGFRNYSGLTVSSLIVDPIDFLLFYTGSFNVIDCWIIENTSINLIKKIKMNDFEANYITFFQIVCYKVNSIDTRDFVCGTADGKLGIYRNSQKIHLENIQLGASVIIFKMVQIANEYYLFLAFSDSFLRIFDLKFNKLIEMFLGVKSENKTSCCLNSLDVNVCQELLTVITGSTLGFITECQFEVLKDKDEKKEEFKIRLNLKSKNVVQRFHSIESPNELSDQLKDNLNKRIFFDVNEHANIMVTCGSDKTVFIWNLYSHTLITEKSLNHTPTCLKLSKTGEELYIGFSHSLVLVFQIKFDICENKENDNRSVSCRLFREIATLNDEKVKSPVVNILISDSNKYLAVSYLSRIVSDNCDDDSKESASIKMWERIEKSDQENSNELEYLKMKNFRFGFSSMKDEFILSELHSSSYFMAFSDNEEYLMAYYQQIGKNGMRESKDKSGLYLLWNIKTGIFELDYSFLSKVSFSNFNFPTHLNVKTRPYTSNTSKLDMLLNNVDSTLNNLNDNAFYLSCVESNHSKMAIFGTDEGEILLSKFSFFQNDRNLDLKNDSLDEFCQAKRIAAHFSPVDIIKLNKTEQKLYSTGFKDHCVIEWEIVTPKNEFELDDKDIDIMIEDEFLCEIPELKTMQSYFAHICYKHSQFSSVISNIDFLVVPDYDFRPFRIIGRKAFTCRSNIFITKNSEIIYPVGTFLIIEDFMKRWSQILVGKRVSEKGSSRKNWMKSLDQMLGFQKKLKSNCEISPGKEINKNTTTNDFKNQTIHSSQNVKFFERENHGHARYETESISESQHGLVSMTNKSIFEALTLKQDFIFANNNFANQARFEISCVELASDFRTLCIGVMEENSHLYFWDITCKSLIGSTRLDSCCCPIIIRFSNDQQSLVCLGITKTHSSCLFFIDVKQFCLKAVTNFSFSLPFKIKDITFYPLETCQFLTVGINHIAKWTYQNGLLNCVHLDLESVNSGIFLSDRKRVSKRFSSLNEDSFGSFLVVKFIFQNIFVLGCSKGFIYIFIDDKLIMKQKCFDQSPVVVIVFSPFIAGDFIVGGFNQKMLYFRSFFDNLLFNGVMALFEIAYFDETENCTDKTRVQLQSLLYVDEFKLIFGTRSGCLGEIQLNSENLKKIEGANLEASDHDERQIPINLERLDNKFSLLYQFFDNEIPKIADFSTDENSIYILTDNGLLIVYHRESLECLKKKNFKRKAVDMLVLDQEILLVFQQEILIVDCSNDFVEINRYYMQTQTDIDKVRINVGKNQLAILLLSSPNFPSMIKIFNIADQLNLLFTINVEKVDYLDFSLNKGFLMYQEASGNKYLLNLEEDEVQQLDTKLIHELKWMKDGMLLPESLKSVRIFYESLSEIINIVTIDDNNFIVADKMGSVDSLD